MKTSQQFFKWILGGLALGLVFRALQAPTEAKPVLDLGPATPSAVPATAIRLTSKSGIHKFVTTLVGRTRDHTTTVIAGSLAYYALLALFPGLIAAISIYGLVQDPTTLAVQINELANQLPASTAELINTQLTQIVNSSGAGLGVATTIGIATALWSASAGAKVLITGVNLAYGEREIRSFIVLRSMALLVTLIVVTGVVGVVGGVAFLPAIADGAVVNSLRWPVLVLVVTIGLGGLYRIAPSGRQRRHPIWPGAITTSGVWLLATVGFSSAVTSFGSFNVTYGALGGVIVLLLWFFLSGLIVLLGAELNATIETHRITA